MAVTHTLLISADTLKNNTTISESVDTNLIHPVVLLAQDRYILPVLGTDLFEKLKTEVAGTPNVADSSSDIGMFRVLYRYSQTLSVDKRTGQISSREFCQKMVAKSVAGTLYRMEDLEKASQKAVNKGFGPNGSSKYSI